MATHSSILAWRIPWTEEPGGLQSMGSQRVGRDWATNIFTFTFPSTLGAAPFPAPPHPPPTNGINLALFTLLLVSQMALVVKNLPANAGDIKIHGFDPWVRKISEEGMAMHSSFPAWRIPWTEEPGRLQSIGLRRVGRDWSDLAHRYPPLTFLVLLSYKTHLATSPHSTLKLTINFWFIVIMGSLVFTLGQE